MNSAVTPLRWDGACLHVLDQRALPQAQRWLRATDLPAVIAAIRDMAVRGAPAIAIAGAYGMALAARDPDLDPAGAGRALLAARPTAVHLAWVVERLLADAAPDDRAARWLAFAERLAAEDARMNRAMGEAGAALLPAGARVLTHCNTGALATAGWGTALGVIRSAHAAGRLAKVWVDETRPWLQGARLTAWELAQEGIAHRLIADSAGASLMANGEVDWVVVGADRIAANGDTANKIGTYMLAVLARHHGLGFMVVAPSATIDWKLADGTQIPIEERGAEELTTIGGRDIAPPGCAVHNPVFDVTPAALITALVTERGVLERPDSRSMQALA